jgi:hypothetical protein
MLFIPDDVHTGHLPRWVRTSAQTTDGYLLALANSRGAHLATLDRFIPGAVLIPDDTAGPLRVRDEAVHDEWDLMRSSGEHTGSHEIASRMLRKSSRRAQRRAWRRWQESRHNCHSHPWTSGGETC